MAWIDSDDVPELTEEFFADATPMLEGRAVPFKAFAVQARKRMGRPPVKVMQLTLNMRVDPDVLEALKASRKGWQTRLNALLRREILNEQA